MDVMQLKRSAQPRSMGRGTRIEIEGAVVIDDVVTAVRFLLSFSAPGQEVEWSQHSHGAVI